MTPTSSNSSSLTHISKEGGEKKRSRGRRTAAVEHGEAHPYLAVLIEKGKGEGKEGREKKKGGLEPFTGRHRRGGEGGGGGSQEGGKEGGKRRRRTPFPILFRGGRGSEGEGRRKEGLATPHLRLSCAKSGKREEERRGGEGERTRPPHLFFPSWR